MQQHVQQVLHRVLVDDDFLDQMRSDPEAALEGYDLSDDERSVLQSRNRDLLELMRIGGVGNRVTFLFLDLDITLVIDLTEFITTLHLDITIDLTTVEAEERQRLGRERIGKLAESVRSMRAGADRLERIQEMLQTLSGATELARPAPGGTDELTGRSDR
jgi:hypothetical protein